jgi:5'-nucleotidase
MKVLLTNDDGIAAEGLQAVRRALLALADVELAVIAPDGNRSAIARGITTRRPLVVERVDFDDGTHGFQTDGTPTDCVRLASLGLIDGFTPELVVSGINHGSNLADDIAYSGTVAAAFEGVVLGLPAIAVSQQGRGGQFDFAAAARFVANLVDELDEVPIRRGTLLNVNVPAGEPRGVEVAAIGKRIYDDALELLDGDDGRRTYRIYGVEPGSEEEPGTDTNAVAEGRIAVTPLHFDLADREGIDVLAGLDLERLAGQAEERA